MNEFSCPAALDAPVRLFAAALSRAAIAASLALLAAANLPGGEIEDALARPTSPGSIALLTRFARDPRATERLDKALANQRADIRAAAARVAHVGFVRGLQGPIERALNEETDADAAREEIRALAVLSGGKAEDRILRARKRFGGILDVVVADTLARTLGSDALDRIVAGQEPFRGEPGYRRTLIAEASRGQKSVLESLARRSLEERNEIAWVLLLTSADELDLSMDPELLRSAIRPPYPGIASAAAWALAKAYAFDRPSDAERLLSSLPRMDQSDPDTAFAFEVLRRSLGSAVSDRSESIRSAKVGASKMLDSIGAKSAILRLLTPQELDALRGRAADAGIGLGGESDWTPPSRRPLTRREQSPVVRTAGDLPRGMGHALLSESGCTNLGDRFVGAAEVTYGPDGRPARVSTLKGHGPRRCEQAAISLFLLALAPGESFPILDRPDIVLAMSDESCPGSLDEEPVVGDHAASPDPQPQGIYEPPVVEKRVKPTYPANLVQDNIRGTVVLEADISSEGCVKNIRTIETAHPGLDLETVRAAAQYRYRPAKLGGKPVPARFRYRVDYRRTGT